MQGDLLDKNGGDDADFPGDDTCADDRAMMVALADRLYNWPSRNQVVEKALRAAAQELLLLAQEQPV